MPHLRGMLGKVWGPQRDLELVLNSEMGNTISKIEPSMLRYVNYNKNYTIKLISLFIKRLGNLIVSESKVGNLLL